METEVYTYVAFHHEVKDLTAFLERQPIHAVDRMLSCVCLQV